MKVSVWATKCHYCGEEMGRPRREEKKLTMRDLGGAEPTTYKPSGNVTGALESFRVEEVSYAEELRAQRQKVGWLGRLMGKKPPAPRKPSEPAMTELDEYNRNLTASILDDMSSSSSMSISRSRLPPATRTTAAQRLIQVVLVVMGLAALYFGGDFAWAKISDYLHAQEQTDEFIYNNRAPRMLARGEQPILALEEAKTAISYNDTPENREIAAEARERVLQKVDDLMARNPWSRKDHDEAYSIIQRAINVDTHPSVQNKYDSLSAEIAKFKFVLKSVDPVAEEATFRLNNPDYAPEVTVGVADRVMDRFIVQRITSRNVDLLDEKVSRRKLTISLNEGVRSRY